MKLYQWIAQRLAQIENLEEGKFDYAVSPENVREEVEGKVHSYLPRGSGFDVGTKLDWDRSNKNRLVFTTEFHHMNDVGMYDGWTAHDVFVNPDLCFDFTLRVTGRNRNDIKDLIHEQFNHALLTDID